MANGPVITLPAAILEGDDFLVLALLDHFTRDGSTFNERTAVRKVVAVAMKQNVAENGFLARFTLEQIDIDNVALGNAMLSAACFDNCVSHDRRKVGESHTDGLI
jgi:hypothetical protein